MGRVDKKRRHKILPFPYKKEDLDVVMRPSLADRAAEANETALLACGGHIVDAEGKKITLARRQALEWNEMKKEVRMMKKVRKPLRKRYPKEREQKRMLGKKIKSLVSNMRFKHDEEAKRLNELEEEKLEEVTQRLQKQNVEKAILDQEKRLALEDDKKEKSGTCAETEKMVIM